VFVAMLLAAMHPESNIPDTPARKVGCVMLLFCYSVIL
jgi:hypothetical protein